MHSRLVLTLTMLSLMAWSQDTATIVGTVTDSTGAVIPGARVTVSNPEKGIVRNLNANSVGEYAAAKLPIGNYVVTGEQMGFQRLVRSGITLEVGQTLRVNLQMQLGDVNQEVTVVGNAPRVETETSTVSTVVTGSQVMDLALNGRSFLGLYLLVPGAVGNNASVTGAGSGVAAPISFNGSRYQLNTVEIDGVPNIDDGAGGGSQVVVPSLESIAEFRVSTSNYGAEQGQAAAAIVEMATKSGTRDFHGTAYNFIRNDVWDANPWFINRQAQAGGGKAPKTPLKWNDFGYSFGGPVFIPGKYNKERSKTFFFWSQNWRRYRQGRVIDRTVPSLRMRNGDFSECDRGSPNYHPSAAAGCVVPIDPATRAPFPNSIVPVDPNSKALLDAFVPLPNNGPVGYVAAPTASSDWHQEQLRIDHNLSPNTTAFVRITNENWDYGNVPLTRAAPTLGAGNYDTVMNVRHRAGKNIAGRLTHNFSPALLNEVIVGYSVDNIFHEAPSVGPSSVSRSLAKPPGWNLRNLFVANAGRDILPGISLSGGIPGFTMSAGDWPSGTNAAPTPMIKNHLFYMRGKHTLKTGFFLTRFHKRESYGFFTQGYLTFRGSSAVTTRNALADMYLVRIAEYREGTQTVNGNATGGYAISHIRYTDFEPYVQDDWKVSRRLTLNLGFRYYLFTPFHDVSNPTKDTTFIPSRYDPAAEARLAANGNIVPGSGHDFRTYGNGLVPCGTGGVPIGCVENYRKNLAPRIGFAFDPTGSGKTAIRGGYGISYDIGYSGGATSAGTHGGPPVVLSPSGFNIVGYSNVVPGAFGPASLEILPQNQKYASIQHFSFTVQREFGGNNFLSVGYVGTLGRHLPRVRDINQVPLGMGPKNIPALAGARGCDAAGNCDVQTSLINNYQPSIFFVPYSGYGSISMHEATAISNYNALQLNFRHTVGHGLNFQAAYAWQHSLDDNTSGNEVGIDDSNLSRWYATSDLNRTHTLVMNYTYDLPLFRGAKGVVGSLFGGWRISGITSFFSGLPITPGCGLSGLSSGIGRGVVCNPVGAVQVKKGVVNDPVFGPTPTWFDPGSLSQPALGQLRADGQPGMFGYLGRNVLAGPGRNNWDLALMKNVALPWMTADGSTLQFRWEAFNAFNHSQWNSVRSACSARTPAGQACTGSDNIGVGQITGAFDPRIMQFALKFIF